MGANAQTTVPTFTAAQVLTAAQMNQSARTGVPVFATTTDRDAAFGGAGEKTLAEGQLAYIEATDIVQYYDGSAWAQLGPAGVFNVQTNTIDTLQNTTSTTFTDLTTVGPTVTITTGTRVLVLITYGTISPSGTSGRARASVAVSGATTTSASDVNCLAGPSGNNTREFAASAAFLMTVTAGSNTFTMKYRVENAGGTAGFENRKLIVCTL